jgi:glycine cleavage system H protein
MLPRCHTKSREDSPMKFAKSHEWVRVEGDPAPGAIATIGISAYAVEALTDLVFMQLPRVGDTLTAGESFGEIESVKAVSDLYAPCSGEVVEVHEGLPNDLDILGRDPYGEGWIVKLKLADPSELDQLMDQTAYDAVVREQSQ